MEGRLKKMPSSQEEEYLFHPPTDLVCPITHELFREPVLNSAGQMYEREAFLQFLSSTPNAVDPISRERLNPEVLTPVVKTRCSALEYRENVSRACVEIACGRDCQQPIKYLRRAADLCSGGDLQVPGLTLECIEQLHRPSEDGSEIAMWKFAEGLLEMGDRDKAVAVYYNLLRACEDKEQQAGLLRRCVECWSSAGGESDNYTVQKLSEFVRNQDSLSWGQIIDIMQKGNISESLTLRLCEELLLGKIEEGEIPSWDDQKDVLMKYVAITSHTLTDKQDWMESELQRILDWRDKALRRGGSARSRAMEPISSLRERRKPFFLRKKFVASLVFCVSSIVQSQNIIVRLGHALSVLYILNTNQVQ